MRDSNIQAQKLIVNNICAKILKVNIKNNLL